ncbi:MAG: ABC transporter ATP-binding protein [Candidatus Bathyarchaeota archaeon]|jgi:peptide/nickel transport system ATP-binding protein/oligopeptide transport system ATP-binding protein|nr:ABC transporter ATP-binding protein [Candidatus Bathyarchaeota archaeon]MDP7443427.1 ABC transporter ATP-binding protein [Candidatus Bathyarchaeota archaeon]
MSEILLRVRDLKTYFFTSLGLVKAVDGVSFKIHKGEVLGLIGESGSGKSVTALSIMNLIPSPPGKIVDGQVLLDDFDLLQTKESEMWKIRGKRIAMSFQDPMTYLNPVHRIGDQIAEAIIIHQKLRKSEAFEKAIEIMELVQIPDAPQKARDYPHMLSGGMRQRVLLAMALSCNPELIIADEPTTALDVIVQANILDLLKDLKLKLNLSMLLISHDLGVVARLADRVAIMYAGRIMEYGEITTIFDSPKNPYTIGLLDSLPRIEEDQEKLISIPGDIPDMINPPSGCRFNPRCSHAISRCREEVPSLIEYEKDHLVACFQINKF